MMQNNYYKILGFNSMINRKEITKEEVKNNYDKINNDINKELTGLYHSPQNISINEFKRKRKEVVERLSSKKAEIDKAYSILKNNCILALRNAIIKINNISNSGKLALPKEQVKKEESKLIDINAYEKNELIFKTDYLKIIKTADVVLDIKKMHENNEFDQDRTLARYSISLLSNGKRGYTYNCYLQQLDTEKLQEYDYQKALLEAIENVWMKNQYTYCEYIGKIAQKEDGTYVIEKDVLHSVASKMAEDNLWKKYYERTVNKNEKGER